MRKQLFDKPLLVSLVVSGSCFVVRHVQYSEPQHDTKEIPMSTIADEQDMDGVPNSADVFLRRWVCGFRWMTLENCVINGYL